MIIAGWQTVAGLFVGTSLLAVGTSLSFPALMTLAVRGAPASERGSVVGTFTAFFDLGFGVGAAALGGVAALTGIHGAFLVAAGAAVAGWALLMRATSKGATNR